ncbi:PadR family transcriptional regulator (plasmid) [Deinococcus wulumuqiensis]|uniref:PadR family transcriptional regulator n=1 Tax=Deinococcus wulumuqiensis TaxID=980427 RepID=A0A345ILA8_9DEIO|nr:PadR family transcriptional regulator [Deinococcus wulumuqiensis]
MALPSPVVDKLPPIVEDADMPPGPQINMNAMKVMAVLYSDTTGQQYGLSLSRATGIGNGTLYPILDKLEELKLIQACWEEIDPRVAGRRPRRFYTLTGEGIRTFEAARAALFPPGLAGVARA